MPKRDIDRVQEFEWMKLAKALISVDRFSRKLEKLYVCLRPIVI